MELSKLNQDYETEHSDQLDRLHLWELCVFVQIPMQNECSKKDPDHTDLSVSLTALVRVSIPFHAFFTVRTQLGFLGRKPAPVALRSISLVDLWNPFVAEPLSNQPAFVKSLQRVNYTAFGHPCYRPGIGVIKNVTLKFEHFSQRKRFFSEKLMNRLSCSSRCVCNDLISSLTQLTVEKEYTKKCVITHRKQTQMC